MHTMAVLANIIDTWTANGNQFLNFLRYVAFPILVCFAAFKAYTKSERAAGAMVAVLIGGTLVWVAIINPTGTFNLIGGAVGLA